MDDFKSMSLKDLTEYILKNRSDEDAWDEFVSRPRPNATIIPFDISPEEYQKTIKQLFFRERENSSNSVEQISASEFDRKKELSEEEILEILKDIRDGQREIIKAFREGRQKIIKDRQDALEKAFEASNNLDNRPAQIEIKPENSTQSFKEIIESQKALKEDIKSMTGWKAFIAPLIIAVAIPLLVCLVING